MILAPEDILYFERSGRVTKMVTVWGNYEIWDKLKDVMTKLSEVDFVRCHRQLYCIYACCTGTWQGLLYPEKRHKDHDKQKPHERGKDGFYALGDDADDMKKNIINKREEKKIC